MRKTKLATAVSLALAGSAGVLNTAQAVNVNPDNLGEVLLYPYYTVRNGTDTLIAVVNTQNEVKAVKVRFLEGKNSKEVLDFNLYLSPFDVWTGAIVQTAEGAKITTSDKSCTVPAIPEGGVEFRNDLYATVDPDGEDPTLNRTREGYLEVIEMAVIDDQTAPVGDFTPEAAATHVDGVPSDCQELITAWSGGVWTTNPAANVVVDPTTGNSLGGLMGQAVLINVEQGTDYSYTATAIDDFFELPSHTEPGSVLPNLASGKAESNVFTGQGVLTSTWNNSTVRADSVSAVLMHDNVMNTYVTDASISAGTDWVVNFPTKRFYVEVNDPKSPSNGAATPPFTEDFWTGGSCDDVALNIWDREERTAVGGVDFSPQIRATNSLCWEVNVITFNNTSVLGSELQLNVDTTSVGESGWMRLSFPSDGTVHRMVDDAGAIYLGLPTIGFAVQEYVNGDLDGIRSNYGGLFNHAGTLNISGAP